MIAKYSCAKTSTGTVRAKLVSVLYRAVYNTIAADYCTVK